MIFGVSHNLSLQNAVPIDQAMDARLQGNHSR
jgi:hypothetical protein